MFICLRFPFVIQILYSMIPSFHLRVFDGCCCSGYTLCERRWEENENVNEHDKNSNSSWFSNAICSSRKRKLYLLSSIFNASSRHSVVVWVIFFGIPLIQLLFLNPNMLECVNFRCSSRRYFAFSVQCVLKYLHFLCHSRSSRLGTQISCVCCKVRQTDHWSKHPESPDSISELFKFLECLTMHCHIWQKGARWQFHH